jgi:hypothetical protein
VSLQRTAMRSTRSRGAPRSSDTQNAAVLAFVDWLTTLVVELEVDHGAGGGAGKAKVVLMGHSCISPTMQMPAGSRALELVCADAAEWEGCSLPTRRGISPAIPGWGTLFGQGS